MCHSDASLAYTFQPSVLLSLATGVTAIQQSLCSLCAAWCSSAVGAPQPGDRCHSEASVCHALVRFKKAASKLAATKQRVRACVHHQRAELDLQLLDPPACAGNALDPPACAGKHARFPGEAPTSSPSRPGVGAARHGLLVAYTCQPSVLLSLATGVTARFQYAMRY